MNSIQTLLTDHLDIWTAADTEKKSGRGRSSGNADRVYGIRKLRELILELAVRGKLVPQDTSDEPASVLLERLAREKARLITEGKLGKSQPLPDIAEEEIPFKLPATWEWVRLGNVGEIFNGNSINEKIKETKYTNLEGGLPFIATKDVGYGWQELDYKNGVSIPEEEPNFKVAHKGSVLICSEGGSAGKKCGITVKDICFGNKLYALEPYADIEPNFLLANYLTPTFFAQFRERMTGIIGGVSIASFNQLLLPLPSVNEQHRIVAKAEELMALCDQLEQQQTGSLGAHQNLVEALLGTLTRVASQQEFSAAWARIANHFDTLFTSEASIDQLKQTILQLAVTGKLVPQDPNDEPASVLLERIAAEKERLVGEHRIKKDRPLSEIEEKEKPYQLPDSWEWARIGMIALTTDYGLSEKSFNDASGVPVLKMGDIVNGEVVLGGQKTVAENTEGLPELLLEKGDLLYNRTNSAELVGKTGLYGGPSGYYTFASYLIRIRLANEFMAPEFLNICMNSPIFRETQIAPYLKQQCGQANVNGTIMRNMRVPVPPYAEQRRIVAKVDELMPLCDALKARLADAQTIQLHLADAIVEQAVC